MVEHARRIHVEAKSHINLDVRGIIGPSPQAEAPAIEVPRGKRTLGEVKKWLEGEGLELVTSARSTVKEGENEGCYEMPLLDIFSKRLVGHLICQEEIIENTDGSQ